jgi:hypothetical protein
MSDATARSLAHDPVREGEERAAWIQFAAAYINAAGTERLAKFYSQWFAGEQIDWFKEGDPTPQVLPVEITASNAAKYADAMLDELRTRWPGR